MVPAQGQRTKTLNASAYLKHGPLLNSASFFERAAVVAVLLLGVLSVIAAAAGWPVWPFILPRAILSITNAVVIGRRGSLAQEYDPSRR